MILLDWILATIGLSCWFGALGWYFRKDMMAVWARRKIAGFRPGD